MFRFAQHDNEIFCMRYFVSLRASTASVAINRQGIPMILALYTVDCFGYRLAMTRGSVHKNFIVMLSVSETSLSDSKLLWIPSFSSLSMILRLSFFFKGDRGLNCEAAPYPPLTPNPCTLLNCLCSARIMSYSTALRLC